jgi:hypothetical protein
VVIYTKEPDAMCVAGAEERPAGREQNGMTALELIKTPTLEEDEP